MAKHPEQILASRGITEITKPDQWYYVLQLIRRFMYRGRYGLESKLVDSVVNPKSHDDQGIIDGIMKLAIVTRAPVPLVSFCGIGNKADLDESDYIGFNAFAGLHEFLCRYYPPGIAVVVIVADIHGRFNGYENEGYSIEVENYLKGQPWVERTVKMGELYAQYGLELPTPETIDDSAISLLAEDTALSDIFKIQAQRHYHGEFQDFGHILYAQMRLQEREMLRREFDERILCVHGSESNSQQLLSSDIGIFYLNMKPHWFREDY